jgi:hypothetical protein
MTESDFKSQLQEAQDMLTVMEELRNAHANNVVQLGAKLKAAGRRIAELEQLVKAREAKLIESDEPELPNITPQRPATNGHAEQAH